MTIHIEWKENSFTGYSSMRITETGNLIVF